MNEPIKPLEELVRGPVQTMRIIDMRLDRDNGPLGCTILYVQIQRADGQTIGFQWPFKMGDEVKDFARELYMMCDEVAVLATAKIHMNTCKTCKWWVPDEIPTRHGRPLTTHECLHEKVGGNAGDDCADGISFFQDCYALTTGPDFGCIHHEERK